MMVLHFSRSTSVLKKISGRFLFMKKLNYRKKTPEGNYLESIVYLETCLYLILH